MSTFWHDLEINLFYHKVYFFLRISSFFKFVILRHLIICKNLIKKTYLNCFCFVWKQAISDTNYISRLFFQTCHTPHHSKTQYYKQNSIISKKKINNKNIFFTHLDQINYLIRYCNRSWILHSSLYSHIHCTYLWYFDKFELSSFIPVLFHVHVRGLSL